MTINAAFAALLEELAEEIPDVLSTRFTFAGLWADLARVAGEPVPRDVAAVLDAPLDIVSPAARFTPYRGSFADRGAQFPEMYAD